MPVVAQGTNGRVTLDDAGWLTFERTGLAKIGHSGARQMHVGTVVTVELRPPTMLGAGFFRVSTAASGDAPLRRTGKPIKEARKLMDDDNAVMFKKSQMPAFEALQVAIRSHTPTQ